MNKIKSGNWIQFIFILIVPVVISLVLFRYSIIDVQTIKEYGSDFHYNAISMSAIVGGFLFTGVSILISAIDKERIKRLWECNYLDNLYHSAFGGMLSNVTTIIIALVLLGINFEHIPEVQEKFIVAEIMTLLVGITCFIVCIKYLFKIITKLKGN